jgi:hypothetical protein
MANTDKQFGNGVVLIEDGTEITATGTGTVILDSVNKSTLRLVADVAAVSGTDTPTITFTVETSSDKFVADTRTVAAGSGITATGKTRKVFAGLDRWTRIKWVVSGTNPEFTLGVYGELV